MKDIFLTFPEPLRKQILLQCAGGGFGIAMFLILLVYGRDWYFLFPCAALVIVSLSGATSLYDRCRQERYVTIEAACTEITRTPFRRRIKSLYLRSEQYTTKLVGVRNICGLAVGDTLTLYVSDNAAIYEMDGSMILCSYLALSKVQRQKD